MEHQTNRGQENQEALLARMMRLEQDLKMIASSLRIERPEAMIGEGLEPRRDMVPRFIDARTSDAIAVRPFLEPIINHAAHAARQERLAKAALARKIIAELFADPAWDMLLGLYAAFHERRNVSISSLCIAAAVPATTALRWIKTMTDKGMLCRTADVNDGRRIYVHLAESHIEVMDEFLTRIDERELGKAPI